jgi:hypothetical protein
MRTVASNIEDMGLEIGQSVTLQLVDSVGNVCNTPVGGMKDVTVEISGESITFDLVESDFIPMATHYRMTVPDGTKFLFRVPRSLDNEETAHDLEALMRSGCVESVVDITEGTVSDSMLERFDDWLDGAPPDFSAAEMDMIGLYVYYADIVQLTTRTIDTMQKFDAFLASVEE